MSKKSKYQGIHFERTLQSNPLEADFAEAWRRINEDTFECSGHLRTDLVDQLLAQDQYQMTHASDHDREVAATVIQWLGSSVGQAWLKSVQGQAKEGQKAQREEADSPPVLHHKARLSITSAKPNAEVTLTVRHPQAPEVVLSFALSSAGFGQALFGQEQDGTLSLNHKDLKTLGMRLETKPVFLMGSITGAGPNKAELAAHEVDGWRVDRTKLPRRDWRHGGWHFTYRRFVKPVLDENGYDVSSGHPVKDGRELCSCEGRDREPCVKPVKRNGGRKKGSRE